MVYKTTNLVNGKIYIGKHETNDINDGYLGSGKLLKRAIKKYGEENFKREILFECSTKEEMNAKEAELVNEEFLKCDNVYNLKQGGDGGFDFINTNQLNTNPESHSISGKAFAKRLRNDPKFREQISNGIKRIWKEHPEQFKNIHKIDPLSFKGKHHTEETKKKISEKNKRMVGELNSNWGTVWVYNERLEQNKKVKKEQVETFLNQGWKLGRKMNFYN